MAWPTSFTASTVLSGKGAKTAGQDLYDRDVQLTRNRTSWAFGQSQMTTTLADVESVRVRVPEYCLTGATIKLKFRAQRDGAVSGTANFRIREVGTPTNGSTLGTTLTTAFAIYEVELAVVVDSWAGTVREFALQAQRPASGTDNDWLVVGKSLLKNFVFEAA
jgi:hypothetical protein